MPQGPFDIPLKAKPSVLVFFLSAVLASISISAKPILESTQVVAIILGLDVIGP